jgi:hypothetical protein
LAVGHRSRLSEKSFAAMIAEGLRPTVGCFQRLDTPGAA